MVVMVIKVTTTLYKYNLKLITSTVSSFRDYKCTQPKWTELPF